MHVAVLSDGLRRTLARTPGAGIVRSLRRRQQLAEFAALLELAADVPADAELRSRRRLDALRAERRTPGGRRPGVVAFGTREWEQHGLWQSFAAVSDFDLWDYRQPYAAPPTTDAAYRRRQAAAFLRFVDDIETRRAVHLAFFYASAEHIAPALIAELRGRGIWTVIMSLDDKRQFARPVDPGTGLSLQRQLAPECDLYWTTWRLGARLVAAAGGSAWFAPEGAHPAFHRPLPVERDLDIVFVGQAYGSRGALVRYLRRRGLHVAAYGVGWPAGFISFDETVALYSRARIVLGFGGAGHMTEVKHLKGRDFEVPMCGALYLTSFNPELAEFYAVGSEIVCYGSSEEAAERAVHLLGEPAEAQQIRDAALLRSRRDHTWEKRINDLFAQTVGGHVPPAEG